MDNDSTHNEVSKKSRFPKKLLVAILIVLIVGGLAFYYKRLFIAAMVGGRPISRLSVIQRIEKQSGKAALDMLINELLINKEARAKGINVNDGEVNEQIKTIETQIVSQGGTLDAALRAQGLDREELKKQIRIEKLAEKLLADKVQISDKEIEDYLKATSTAIPAGHETEYKNRVKDQLRSQKFGNAFNQFINDLRSRAKIRYFVNY